jgi:acetyl esterase
MPNTPTRAQLITQVQKKRSRLSFLYKLSGYGAAKFGKEVLLETEAGRVRALFYGFEDEAVKPVLFDMHGGGFILMDAAADEAMNVRLQSDVGCKIISIDYTLAPEHPFPAAVQQVYAVVKAVHDHAEEYKIDPRRMAIGGHSAGGNLAAVTCIQAGAKREFEFACQLLDYPPLDLATSPYDKPCPRGAIKPKQAATYDACYVDPGEARNPLVSPVYATRDQLTGLPPALLILAGHDSLYDEGAKYGRLLAEAGVTVETHVFPEEKHGFTYFRSKGAPQALDLMSVFLKKNLSLATNKEGSR